jgi:hypothetical protein
MVILVVYSLLDESMRYSRALILLGGLWAYLAMTGSRLLFNILGIKGFKIGELVNKRYLIVGDQQEAERVAHLLSTIESQPAFIGLVSAGTSKQEGFIGHLDQLSEIAEIYSVNEIIFCAKSMPSRHIIDKMSSLKMPGVEYKIAPPESLSLIGSNSINTAGDLYTMEINSIGKFTNRRNKRFFDFSFSLLLLLAFPVLIFIVKNPFGFFRNLAQVFAAYKTWVGYCKTPAQQTGQLPKIKNGVLNPANALHINNLNQETLERLNLLYARDYRIKTDVDIIFKGIRFLGN